MAPPAPSERRPPVKGANALTLICVRVCVFMLSEFKLNSADIISAACFWQMKHPTDLHPGLGLPHIQGKAPCTPLEGRDGVWRWAEFGRVLCVRPPSHAPR